MAKLNFCTNIFLISFLELNGVVNDTPSLPKEPAKKTVRKGLPPKSQKVTKAGSQNSLNIHSPKSKSSPNLHVGAVLELAKPMSSIEHIGKRQRDDSDTAPNKKKKIGKENRSMEVDCLTTVDFLQRCKIYLFP